MGFDEVLVGVDTLGSDNIAEALSPAVNGFEAAAALPILVNEPERK